MAEASTPDREKILEILNFLPDFSRPGRQFTPESWKEQDVRWFFELLTTEDYWNDSDLTKRTYELIEHPSLIDNASFEDIRRVLFYCVCDGDYVLSMSMLEKGIVQATLRRLKDLLEAST
jgi:hypothetical protein